MHTGIAMAVVLQTFNVLRILFQHASASAHTHTKIIRTKENIIWCQTCAIAMRKISLVVGLGCSDGGTHILLHSTHSWCPCDSNSNNKHTHTHSFARSHTSSASNKFWQSTLGFPYREIWMIYIWRTMNFRWRIFRLLFSSVFIWQNVYKINMHRIACGEGSGYKDTHTYSSISSEQWCFGCIGNGCWARINRS